MPDIEHPAQAPGIYELNGRLFIALPAGTTILCECIRGPYAKQVAALWRSRFDSPPADSSDR